MNAQVSAFASMANAAAPKAERVRRVSSTPALLIARDGVRACAASAIAEHRGLGRLANLLSVRVIVRLRVAPPRVKLACAVSLSVIPPSSSVPSHRARTAVMNTGFAATGIVSAGLATWASLAPMPCLSTRLATRAALTMASASRLRDSSHRAIASPRVAAPMAIALALTASAKKATAGHRARGSVARCAAVLMRVEASVTRDGVYVLHPTAARHAPNQSVQRIVELIALRPVASVCYLIARVPVLVDGMVRRVRRGIALAVSQPSRPQLLKLRQLRRCVALRALATTVHASAEPDGLAWLARRSGVRLGAAAEGHVSTGVALARVAGAEAVANNVSVRSTALALVPVQQRSAIYAYVPLGWRPLIVRDRAVILRAHLLAVFA